MKVDLKAVAAQVVLGKAQPFKQLLAEARSELKKELKPAAPLAVPPGLKAIKSVQQKYNRDLSGKAHVPFQKR